MSILFTTISQGLEEQKASYYLLKEAATERASPPAPSTPPSPEGHSSHTAIRPQPGRCSDYPQTRADTRERVLHFFPFPPPCET